MKYSIGSGNIKEEGFISVDISDKCGADIVADVREPWTWALEPIEELKSYNLLEHLSVEERISVMNEAHDRMKPGGKFFVRVPLLKLDEAHFSGAFSDPTHKTFWTIETVDYFNKNHARGRVFGRDYGIKLWEVLKNEEAGEKFLDIILQKPL